MLSIMLIKKRGYVVETAATGHQAIDKLAAFAPHVIISDITMPGMDGFEMMGQMRTVSPSPFRAIALSGRDFSGPQRDGSGYDAHLTKPVDFEELFVTIDRLIEVDGGQDGSSN